MSDPNTPTVTPEKVYPFIKSANQEQLETLYRFSHHMIRGSVPPSEDAKVNNFMLLMEEATDRQLLLIFQAAYHLVRKERMI